MKDEHGKEEEATRRVTEGYSSTLVHLQQLEVNTLFFSLVVIFFFFNYTKLFMNICCFNC